MHDSVQDIIEELRVLEQDHQQECWPALRMGTISQLCDEVESLHAAIHILECALMRGCKIGFWQDECWLFDKHGEGLAGGATLKQMIHELNFLEE